MDDWLSSVYQSLFGEEEKDPYALAPTSPRAMAPIEPIGSSISLAGAGSYEEALARAEAERDAKLAEFQAKNAQYEQINASDRELPDAITEGLLGLLPVVAGYAIGGKEGGAIGAKSGLLGASQYDKILTQDALADKARLKEEALTAKQDYRSAGTLANQMATRGLAEKSLAERPLDRLAALMGGGQGEVTLSPQEMADVRSKTLGLGQSSGGSTATMSKPAKAGLFLQEQGQEDLISEEQLKAIYDDKNALAQYNKNKAAGLRGREISLLESGENRRSTKAQLDIQEGYPAGTEAIRPDRPPTRGQREKYGVQRAIFAQQLGALDNLERIYAEKGRMGIIGGAVQSEVSALSTILQGMSRKDQGLGARLEGAEKGLMLALSDPNLTSDGAFALVKNFLLEGDAAERIRAIRKVTTMGFGRESALGFGIKDNTYSHLFDRETQEFIKEQRSLAGPAISFKDNIDKPDPFAQKGAVSKGPPPRRADYPDDQSFIAAYENWKGL